MLQINGVDIGKLKFTSLGGVERTNDIEHVHIIYMPTTASILEQMAHAVNTRPCREHRRALEEGIRLLVAVINFLGGRAKTFFASCPILEKAG
jgi:hypothetical protein